MVSRLLKILIFYLVRFSSSKVIQGHTKSTIAFYTDHPDFHPPHSAETWFSFMPSPGHPWLVWGNKNSRMFRSSEVFTCMHIWCMYFPFIVICVYRNMCVYQLHINVNHGILDSVSCKVYAHTVTSTDLPVEQYRGLISSFVKNW